MFLSQRFFVYWDTGEALKIVVRDGGLESFEDFLEGLVEKGIRFLRMPGHSPVLMNILYIYPSHESAL